MNKKTAANIVKAIYIVDYIYGALLALAGIILFLSGTKPNSAEALRILLPPELIGELSGGGLIFLSLIFLAVGVFHIILGRSVSKKLPWARVIQIVFAVVPVIGTLGSLFSFPIGTAFGIFVIWALLINKDTKKFFK